MKSVPGTTSQVSSSCTLVLIRQYHKSMQNGGFNLEHVLRLQAKHQAMIRTLYLSDFSILTRSMISVKCTETLALSRSR